MVAGTTPNKGKSLVLDQDSLHYVEFGSSSGTNDHNYKSNGSGLPSPGHNFGGLYNNNDSQFHNNGGHYQGSSSYGGYKGNNFKGKWRGRSYYSGPRPYNPPPNASPGILGAPRPFQAHCPDNPFEVPTCQICNKKGMLQLIASKDTVHQSQVLILRFNAKFAGNLVIQLFSAIIETIFPIKASHHPRIFLQCMSFCTYETVLGCRYWCNFTYDFWASQLGTGKSISR